MTAWRRRNGGVPIARLRRRFRDIDSAVIHQCGEEITEVVPEVRSELIVRVEPYLDVSADRSGADQTDFRVAEFKSPDHRSPVVLDEFCPVMSGPSPTLASAN